MFNIKQATARKFIKNKAKTQSAEEKKQLRRIRSVGAVADAAVFRSYDFTRKLKDLLDLHGDKLEVLLFAMDPKENEIDGYPVCRADSFGWNGKIKPGPVWDFTDKEFDLLINYGTEPQIFREVVVARSNALLKAGFGEPANPFQDISIHTPGNKMDAFHSELARYLGVLGLLGNKSGN